MPTRYVEQFKRYTATHYKTLWQPCVTNTENLQDEDFCREQQCATIMELQVIQKGLKKNSQTMILSKKYHQTEEQITVSKFTFDTVAAAFRV